MEYTQQNGHENHPLASEMDVLEKTTYLFEHKPFDELRGGTASYKSRLVDISANANGKPRPRARSVSFIVELVPPGWRVSKTDSVGEILEQRKSV